MQLETFAIWLTLGLYALAAASFIIGLAFAREWALRAGALLTAAGILSHSVGIVVRWVDVGHGPYLGFFEVASLLAWVAAVVFAGAFLRYRGLRIAGAFVMPCALLVLGAALLADRAAQPVVGTLASAWLVIHVLFANLAFGSYAGAFLASVAVLLSGKLPGRAAVLARRLPPAEELDDLAARFVSAGFIFQGVMIATGAVWANEAWGRYWGWDPIETWSLVAWAIYALWLHARLTLGWRGARTAWLAVLALVVVTFSLLGVPIVYDSIHGAYLRMGPLSR